MRMVPEPEYDEWVRRMRERARLDAEELVPRPGFQVLGVAAPELRPAALAAFQQVNGEWEAVTVAYGDWEAPAGPYLAVTTAAARPELTGRGDNADLLRAIDRERNRIASHAGVDEEEPDEPPRYARSRLAAADALICRHGGVWAARLLDRAVTVTITGRGVSPDSVRLEPVTDLRPYLEARNEILGRLAERRRRRPPADLAPAEGVAALRALADYALESHARDMAARRDGREVRHPADWGAVWSALWQRAVSEQQRAAGTGEREADDAVTLAVNHLTRLADEAPWFTDARLRDAAIDETLRHAVLGDKVRSEPAQRAWARYWSLPAARRPSAREALLASWLAAWAAWAAGGAGD